MEQPVLPSPGQRSSTILPRERTPSPVRELGKRSSTPPAPARDFDFELRQVDVIYADDEEIVREAALRQLLQVGFDAPNIHQAENGLGALEHLARLQNEGNHTTPLVIMLDVRMPGMDGRECALQIQELVKKRLLRREPFVICISTIHRQVIVDEGKGNYQIVFAKPINQMGLKEMLDLLRRWWSMGYGRRLPAWKEFDPQTIEVISADPEPVCRLSSSTAFTQAGVEVDSVHDAEDEEELLEQLGEMQSGNEGRPMMILLGRADWATHIGTFVEQEGGKLRREPFVVCTSVDSDRVAVSPAVENFHAFLPRSFGPKDVKWCLELCRLWWLTRGDGPEENSSEASEVSQGSDL